MMELPPIPPPTLIKCSRCGLTGEPRLFEMPFPNEGGYTCSGRYARGTMSCRMDESGLDMFWDGDTLHRWRQEVIDLVTAQAHDASMNDSATDAQALRTIPERIPVNEIRAARAEVKTSPDAIELAEGIAEQVKALIFPTHNDALEDWMMEAIVDEFPTFREHHMSPDADPNDDAFEKLEAHAYDTMASIFLQELLRPLLTRLLNTGDWKEN